jgi:hypothetical protein
LTRQSMPKSNNPATLRLRLDMLRIIMDAGVGKLAQPT